MKFFQTRFFCLAFCVFTVRALAQTSDLSYQVPPKAIAEVVTAPLSPRGSLNPQGTVLLLTTPVIYPPIADLAKPMLRLAGFRIDPTTNGPHQPAYWQNVSFKFLKTNREVSVKLPGEARVAKLLWNASGTRIAFQNTTDHGIELWVVNAEDGKAKQIHNVVINDFFNGTPFAWTPDQKQLLVNLVVRDRGSPPMAKLAPNGPKILEAVGGTKPTSTYEARDVLKNEFDAQLFDYYATSQLALVDPDTGNTTKIGKPAIYSSQSISPDGNFIVVQRMHRPYSYQLTAPRFPLDVDVWSMSGAPVTTIAKLPLADQVPIKGVRTGVQQIRWWPTDAATLVWTEALDGGDWKTKVPFRTEIKRLKAPFQNKAETLLKTEMRVAGMMAFQSGDKMWVETDDEDKHWRQDILVSLNASLPTQKILWEGSRDDAYNEPGQPSMMVLDNGRWVIREDKGSIYLFGEGSSPEGDRPFLDKLNFSTNEKTRLFRCDKEHFEQFYNFVDVEKGTFLTQREAPNEVPNFAIRTLSHAQKKAAKGEAQVDSSLRFVTSFKDPTPVLRKLSRQLVTYKRPDGVELSFTLVLPPEYKKGTRYPTVVHAYPLDYTNGSVAGQVRDSTKTFIHSYGANEMLYALAGYVVLHNTAMPIVGPSMTAYDSYTDQLVASAKAAIDKAVELGVTDPSRVGIIGHSHGGLMTANLLARSNLFRAGVARSGAYNKTLTQFGFQNERRNLWEARQTYIDVSTLFFADKIKSPILFIHGELDQNPGTTPIQSERMFEAVRGNGGTARLVMLPFEGHGYRAQESVLHTLYEMVSWFDKYVKPAKGDGSKLSSN